MLDTPSRGRADAWAAAAAETAGLGLGLGDLKKASFPLPQVQDVSFYAHLTNNELLLFIMCTDRRVFLTSPTHSWSPLSAR